MNFLLIVDGNWGKWETWAACGISCGIGNNFRNRRCDNPPMLYGGSHCTSNADYIETMDPTGIQQQLDVKQPGKLL